MKRNVSFSNLEIRSYDVTLGDAPTQNGPPISLDWNYDPDATEEFDIDHYENIRHYTRRSRSEMVMPPSYRQYLLMREAGFNRNEIRNAMEEAKRTARQRERTVRGLKWQPAEEMVEKARRKLFRSGGGGGRKG